MLSRSRSRVSGCSGTQWLTSTEQAVDRVHQFLNSKRLPNVLNTRLHKEPLRLRVDDIARHKQEAMTQLRVQRFHEPVQPLAADARHPLIADDDVIILLLDVLERVQA